MIYFDNAATSIVHSDALELFNKIELEYPGNSSSTHNLGIKCDAIIQQSSNVILKSLSLDSSIYEVIFTSGATEANNLAIFGYALKYMSRGKHIISAKNEHKSVLEVLKVLEEKYGFTVTLLDTKNGSVDIGQLRNSMSNDTILVTLMSINNEIGAINDLEAIKEILNNYRKCVFHCDATQSIGKVHCDYRNIDLISCSSHKLGGIKGSGFLIKRKNLVIEQIIYGGGQQKNYRSGTMPVSLCVVSAHVVKSSMTKLPKVYECVSSLHKFLLNALSDIDDLVLNIPESFSPFILNFSLENKKSAIIVEGLSQKNIYVGSTSACTTKADAISGSLQAFGRNDHLASNPIRLSFNESNDLRQCEEFIKVFKELMRSLV